MSEQTLSQLYQLLSIEPDAQAEVVLKPLAEYMPEGGTALAAAWLLKHGGVASAPVLLHTLDQSGDRLQALFWLFLKLLSARQQALFYASAAFAPGRSFSKEALLVVWGGEIFNESMRQGIEQDLEALVPALLSLEGERYTLPAALRPYAEQILAQSGDQTAARRLHFQYYRAQIEQWDFAVEPPLQDELAQAAYALEWAAETLPHEAIECAAVLVDKVGYFSRVGNGIEGWIALAQTIITSIDELPVDLLGNLETLANWAQRLNYPIQARTFYETILANPEPGMEVRARIYRGLAEVSSREEAITFDNRALLLYRQLGDQEGSAAMLMALERYTEALELYEKLEHLQGQINALHALGDVADDPLQSITYFKRMIELNQRIVGHGVNVPLMETKIAIVDPDERSAEMQLEALIHEQSPAWMIEWARGARALQLGRLGSAATYLRQAATLAPERSLHAEKARVYASLAHVRLRQGRPNEAVQLLQEGISNFLPGFSPEDVRRYITKIMGEGGEAIIAAWEETRKPFPIWLKV